MLRYTNSLRKEKPDILIGTQMIAKGLDFENVSLVGIVAADISLHIPDYRSAERTFQLLEQVAGRSGRKDPGKVVIQTYTPEHYAIDYSKNHDFEGSSIKKWRKESSCPAAVLGIFQNSIRGQRRGIDIKACYDYGEGLKKELSDIMDHILLFDISEAAVKKIEGSVRWQILIKALNDEKLAELRKRIYSYSENKNYSGCSFGMEINPASMI